MAPPKKHDAPLQRSFVFVPISNPDESSAWRKTVKSHAARNSYGRQRKVVAYQAGSSGRSRRRTSADSQESRVTNGSTRSTPLTDHSRSLVTSQRGSPVSPLSPADIDPFGSFVKPLSHFEKHLLVYFKSALVLSETSKIPTMQYALPDDTAFWVNMSNFWLHDSLSDKGMLACIFLAACRHIAPKYQTEMFQYHANIYKMASMKLLADTMEHDGDDVNESTITKTLVLASDAYLTEEYDLAKQHMRSAGDLFRLLDRKKRGGQPDSDEPVGALSISFTKDKQNDLGTVTVDGLFDDDLGTQSRPVANASGAKQLHIEVL